MKDLISIFAAATVRLVVLGFLLLALSLLASAQNTNFDFQAAQMAADKGDVKAQYDLGQRYRLGLGAPRDYRKAAQYLQKAAQQGNPNAEVTLGSLYGKGRGVPRSVAMAVHWYRKAAEVGHPLGQYAMGNFYAQGLGVTNDMDQAIEWWLKAAKQNQVDAQTALGETYLLPSPSYGKKYLNFTEAKHWLALAAGQGSPVAMNALGSIYESGLGVDQDFKEAAKWYQMAAERGNAQGQADLAQLYMDGRGVVFDLVQSYKWFKLSYMQGSALGTAGFQNFQTHQLLTPQQLGKAEELVQDFQPLADKTRVPHEL
jgi:TPR repeat protein